MKALHLAPPDFPEGRQPSSLVEVLRWRAQTDPALLAITFLEDGEGESERVTYLELHQRVQRAAGRLEHHDARGHPVVLLFEPGVDFLVGFLACLAAGAIAVPLYPPDLKRLSRTLPRFLAIAEDCGADLVLTTEALKAVSTSMFELSPRLAQRSWLTLPSVAEPHHVERDDAPVEPDATAFLQYTSGSTGNPKGVQVSHRALLLNLEVMSRRVGAVPGEATVTWLPSYHDMGLLEGWLRPIFAGHRAVAMPPTAFLKRPSRWLEALSRYRGAVSGAPNFAFELCAGRVTDEELDALDLSSWRVAYCGAEPVRPATIARFTQRLARCGFRPESFCPAYGLAEAGLLVSVGDFTRPPVILPIDGQALEQGFVLEPADPARASRAVGLGRPSMDVRAVDPQTRRALPTGTVGEVWVAGPSLASGYWRKAEDTEATFRAHLDSGEGPYLRTGDLGFLGADGELFVCGRLKDVILLRGRTLHPQDIEVTVEESNPASLRPGCNAAFSVEVDGEERLVVVQEVQRRFRGESPEWQERRLPDPTLDAFAPSLSRPPELDRMLEDIRCAIIDAHGVAPHAVALVKAGSIPKTSSGKIQRRACREAFLHGGLELVKLWRSPLGGDVVPGGARPRTGPRLRAAVERELGRPLDARDDDRPFSALGLDSHGLVALAGALESSLGARLSPSLFFEHPTIARLAAHLEAGPVPGSLGLEAVPASPSEPVAIVGLACRLPRADSPEALWQLLRRGEDALGEVPRDRWDAEALYDADPSAPGKSWSKEGAFLASAADFDARAFGLTPREAARMDPQQRWLLEVAAEALENAGLTPDALAGSRTGVFVGISSFDFARRMSQQRTTIDAYFATGGALSIAANRISYHFDLRGPSLALDSACSSSLVAVHAAIGSLRRGECERAIVGGVNAMLSPELHVAFTKARVLSPRGGCKPFDARADGIARAEGAAVVVLEPLSRALAEQRHLWALLLGSAVNSDGRSNGLMAPNGAAQQAVLREAYRDAGVAPSEVHYIEAHGTGTSLGDPVEAAALAAVLGHGRPAQRPCRLGSVKGNLGHLEAAAGLVGLVKVALSLRHHELVPSAHFEHPNPAIPFEADHLAVQTQHEAWPAPPGTGLAGVSAFGFGGTNAHVVLKEAPVPTTPVPRAAHHPTLVPLSARSSDGLTRLAASYRRRLETPEAPDELEALAFTAARRRSHASHRLALVVDSTASLHARLDDFLSARTSPGLHRGLAPPGAERALAFVFSGQGGQWAGMGRSLFDEEPVFRAAIERCEAALAPVLGWSIVQELLRGEATSRVHRADFTQPLLFALQVGLCELWRSMGIHPQVVVGHSVGEVAAAYVAGKLELSEAARVLAHRGWLMAQATGGAMAAVSLDVEEAARLAAGCTPPLWVAAVNAPAACVLAGPRASLAACCEGLCQRGVLARELRIEVASHGPAMAPLARTLATALAGVGSRPASLPIVSTVTGEHAESLAFDGAHWARHLCEPVLFQRAVEVLLAQGIRYFLEVGPQPSLAGAVKATARRLGLEAHVWSSLAREGGEREALLGAAGALWAAGLPLDFAHLFPEPLPTLPLPSTPWDHERFWPEDGPHQPTDARHPLLHEHTEGTDRQTFAVDLDLATHPWVAEHLVQELPVFPAAGFVAMALGAAEEAWGQGPYALRSVRFERLLALRPGTSSRVQLHLTPGPQGWTHFEVVSRPRAKHAPAWTVHVRGEVRALAPGFEAGRLDRDSLAPRCVEERSADEHYRRFAARGIDYRGSFRSVRRVLRRDGEALGEVRLDGGTAGFPLHPGLLDACLQLMADAVPDDDEAAQTYLPVALDGFTFFAPPGETALAYARLRPAAEGRHVADVTLGHEDGRVWGRAEGLQVQRLDARSSPTRGWTYQVAWEPAVADARAEGPLAQDDGRAWLVLADRSGLGASLAAELTRRGRRVVTASWGPCFRATGEASFELDPADERGFHQLVERSSGAGRPPHLVSLWALDAPPPGEGLLDAAARHVAALVALSRSLARRPPGAAPALWLVTRLAQSLPGDAPPSPVGAALWGLGRCLALEHPRLWGGLVDVDEEAGASDVLDALAAAAGEDQLALRASRRYVPRLVPHAAPHEGHHLTCAPDGAYLVTGGLGDLGRSLCRRLVERGARTLVVVGRSAPDRSRAEVAALEAAGARVRYVQADVSDEAAMARVVDETPSLRGVFHAAGVVAPLAALDTTSEALEAALRPKLAGTWVLHRLTELAALDSFVVFSSASGVWGSKLLGAYAAASHAMDGLVAWRRSRGLVGTSIAWGLWDGSGMAAGSGEVLKRCGLRPMPHEAALDCLESLVASGASGTVVANVDWATLSARFEGLPGRRLLERLTPPPAPPSDAPLKSPGDEALAARRGGPARRDAVVSAVQDAVAHVLGQAPQGLDLEQPLSALGLDSLTANELATRLRAALGVEVGLLSLLGGDSVRRLAERAEHLLRGGGDEGGVHTVDDDFLAELGVHRLPVPVPFAEAGGPANACAILNEDESWTLFDTGVGTAEGLAALEAEARAHGVALDRVTRIILSHGHFDHFGNAQALAERSHARLCIHPTDAAKASGARWLVATLEEHRGYFERLGVGRETLDEAIDALEALPGPTRPVDRGRLEPLTHQQRWRFKHFEATALHAPGHTPGMSCLLASRARVLFASDHLLRHVPPSPLLDFSLGEGEDKFLPLVRYLEGVRGLRELELGCVVPGHGEAFSGHREVLAELETFHAQRRQQLLARLGTGPATVYALLDVFGGRGEPARLLLDVSEVLAALEVLEASETVRRTLRRGVWEFALTR